MSKIIVTVNATIVRDTVDDARQVGQTVATLLGNPNSVKLREGTTFAGIPLVEPVMDRSKVTRGRQEMTVRAGSIVKNYTALYGLDPALFTDTLTLDETTREWSVDYTSMVRTIKALFPGDTEKLDTFKETVAQVLTAEALRGISLKA